MSQVATIDREALSRRLTEAFEKDEYIGTLNQVLAKRAQVRQGRIDALKVVVAQHQTERATELKEAHKHRNLARLAKGKINTAVKRINQAQKTDKTEKAVRKKIVRRQNTIRRLVAARVEHEFKKQIRTVTKL